MTNLIDTNPDYQVGTWTLDEAHSEVSFSVKHMKISKVRGKFEKFETTIVTAEDPKDSTIEAIIDVASVNTGQEARDNHLRTSDFFLVEEHPQLIFRSSSIDVDGDDFTVDGNLTLRGVTQPVTLKGEFGGTVVDGYGRVKAGATASTKINRHDFG
ncbi:MAG: YceI family protein, partial [Lacisediminihabitans sp.]